MTDFKGKVALITGRTSRIGYAAARQLIDKGAPVILNWQWGWQPQ